MQSTIEITNDYFLKIEEAIKYDQVSSLGYARRQLKIVLNALLEGRVVYIKDLDVRFRNLEEFRNWRKTRKYLDALNSDLLMDEIKLANTRNQKW